MAVPEHPYKPIVVPAEFVAREEIERRYGPVFRQWKAWGGVHVYVRPPLPDEFQMMLDTVLYGFSVRGTQGQRVNPRAIKFVN